MSKQVQQMAMEVGQRIITSALEEMINDNETANMERGELEKMCYACGVNIAPYVYAMCAGFVSELGKYNNESNTEV